MNQGARERGVGVGGRGSAGGCGSDPRDLFRQLPHAGAPLARPPAPDREVSLIGAGVEFATYPDTNLKPPAAVRSAGFLI